MGMLLRIGWMTERRRQALRIDCKAALQRSCKCSCNCNCSWGDGRTHPVPGTDGVLAESGRGRCTRKIRHVTSIYSARKALDRKSTRLNSSHVAISYAVFCLKKKTKRQ